MGHSALSGPATLLDCGAFIEARDRKGDTPLRRAVHCRREAVVRLLVERGAAPIARLR
jgi:ankyrin repeat protein